MKIMGELQQCDTLSSFYQDRGCLVSYESSGHSSVITDWQLLCLLSLWVTLKWMERCQEDTLLEICNSTDVPFYSLAESGYSDIRLA